jgi:hypothetical protein
MRKAEQQSQQQQPNVQRQPARQSGGESLASPQGERIAQLRGAMESSPQAEKQRELATTMHAGPASAAQRKLAAMVQSSPRLAAQRKMFGSLGNADASAGVVAQRVGGVEEKEPPQGRFKPVQRIEEDEPLQRKAVDGMGGSPAQLKETAPRANRTGLPDNLKSGIENLSGMSLDHVKVHYNSSQPAQLNALAYAQGADIHVAPGQERHLPHEAWHVVQQAQGRVKPTMQMKGGVPVNDDAGLEHEADMMGTMAMQMQWPVQRSAQGEVFAPLAGAVQRIQGMVVQRVWQTMGPGKLKWDRIMGGLQWFYHRKDESFSYRIVNDTDVPMESWRVVETKEGEHLTEQQLDSLGFAEIDFEEGDDRVQYQAPQPEFGPVDVSMVTGMGEKELVEVLTKHLAAQMQGVNYDRLLYINTFLAFKKTKPLLSIDEALANFDANSAKLLPSMPGGHCGGLSGNLLDVGNYGPGAYLVASKLPPGIQQKGAPEYCHVAAMIRFQSPEDAHDAGLILLEPGFNLPGPIVVKEGRVTSLPQGEEVWDFSLNEDCSEVICQPKPSAGAAWAAKKSREKRMIYRTDVFLNPDMSLTAPLLWMDGRPPILGRDEKGEVVAQIVINYAKSQLEFRIGKTRAEPISFEMIKASKGKNFLGDAAEPLAKLLHMSPGNLLGRIYESVAEWRPHK